MKTGIIVRSNKRGLGYQTYEAWRNYGFDETLHVIDETPRAWEQNPDLYPDATVVGWSADHRLPFRATMDWLQRVDVVFSVETLYDPQLPEWADYLGVATVIQANPEFYRREGYGSEPTTWTWPTDWLVDLLPPGPIVAVPTTNVIDEPPTAGDRLRILHPAGAAASGDRNGTLLFLESLRSINVPVDVRVVCQDGLGLRLPRVGRNVNIETLAGVDDRWAMYEDIDIVVIPRRYGGLCLPALEAAARGCALVMTDCPPNRTYPASLVPAARGRGQATPFGVIHTWVARANALGHMIDTFHSKRALLTQAKAEARQWAADRTWEALRPVYTTMLEDSVALQRSRT